MSNYLPNDEVQSRLNRDKQKLMDFKTIYLLTDFSDHAKNAADYAISAFGKDVSYVLINSYLVRTSAATLIDIEEIAHQESLEQLKDEESRLFIKYSDLKLQSVSKNGTPVDTINDLNEIDPVDLIVVGSKGISRLDEILIGSVTTAIMRGVHKPVLAIPLKARFDKMDKLVMASDLHNANKPNVIKAISQFKSHFDAHTAAATVKMDEKDFTEEEQKLMKELEKVEPLDEIVVIKDTNISKGLMDYCDKVDADLLVVVAKHTSFFKRFFHKSITKELVNHEILPILVLEDS
jgi:nucleotide-binding universal stress UspA family protein